MAQVWISFSAPDATNHPGRKHFHAVPLKMWIVMRIDKGFVV